MTLRPRGRVIFINDDLTSNVQNFLVKQLYINQVLTGEEFDAEIASNSDFRTELLQLDRRVMVVRSLADTTNREYADVVAFVSHGLVAVLENKNGPHGITYPVVDLTWTKLCIFE